MKITISGYGGEITLGSITKEQHVYWGLQDDQDDLNNILMGWPEENEQQHPEELTLRPFYDMDDIAHVYGADYDSAYITVTNDSDEILWQGEPEKLAQLPNCDNLIANEEEYYFSATDHKYGIFCCSAEKGVFTEIEIKSVNEFDPSRLRFNIEDVEGNRIITSIDYIGFESEDTDDICTDGKGFNFEFFTNEQD